MGRRVTFVTRADCGLCAELLPRVRATARLLQIDVNVRDIADDRDLEDEYHLRIPVILGKNDSPIAEGPMNTWAVLRALVGLRLSR